jgi:hypothetical protein
MNHSVASIVFVLGLAGSALSAHHSIAGIYDGARQASIEGVVLTFQFVNPHPVITMKVDTSNGKSEEWRLELDNRFELAAVGMTADTLRPGDRILVTGSVARAQPNGLYVRRLERPADGLQYEQIGTSRRIRRPPR